MITTKLPSISKYAIDFLQCNDKRKKVKMGPPVGVGKMMINTRYVRVSNAHAIKGLEVLYTPGMGIESVRGEMGRRSRQDGIDFLISSLYKFVNYWNYHPNSLHLTLEP